MIDRSYSLSQVIHRIRAKVVGEATVQRSTVRRKGGRSALDRGLVEPQREMPALLNRVLEHHAGPDVDPGQDKFDMNNHAQYRTCSAT